MTDETDAVGKAPGATAHYFAPPPQPAGRRTVVPVRLAGRDVEVVTAAGVFSGDRVDLGTRVLLREAPAPPASGHLLDLGCGWGPLALAVGLLAPAATVWAVDVNDRALDLAAQNAVRLGLANLRVARPDDVPAVGRFSTTWSNHQCR